MDPIKVSVSVMAHPARAALVERLVERLGIDADRVSWDVGDGHRWRTGRQAWLMRDPEATHHVVVQDDALVCRDLVAGLERALVHVPEDSIQSLYVGTRRPSKEKVEHLVAVARASDPPPSWLVMPALNWGVGICVPVETIPEMIAFGDRRKEPNYDRRLGRFYLEALRWNTWCTWPSLVDHLDDEPSLAGHGPGRVAHEFIGEDRSALDVDWSEAHVIIDGHGLLRAKYDRRVAVNPARLERKRRARQERQEGRMAVDAKDVETITVTIPRVTYLWLDRTATKRGIPPDRLAASLIQQTAERSALREGVA